LIVNEEDFEKDLSTILSYVNKLQELDTSKLRKQPIFFPCRII